ncbi:MAG: hypothetical protein K2J36_03855 [Ruminococcus sp.]|nr:hypothetical protein [Ruminococcus sp.]
MGILKKILYKMAGTNEEIESLYREKGPCNEWVDARIAIQKKPKTFDKALNADMLISVGRYAEAEEILDSISLNLMSDDDAKGMTLFERMNLYIHTGRYEKATEIFTQNQKFLDIYFTSPVRERYAIAYFDAISRISAYNHDEQNANNYLSHEKVFSEKYEGDFPVMFKITNVAVLKLLGSESAQSEYEKLKAEIESHDFPMVWQKEHNLKLLSKAFNA